MDAGAFPGDPVVPGDLVVKNLPCNGEDLQIWSLVRELRPHIPQGHYWSHVPQWKIPHDETKTPRAATETQYSQIYTYILFKKKINALHAQNLFSEICDRCSSEETSQQTLLQWGMM